MEDAKKMFSMIKLWAFVDAGQDKATDRLLLACGKILRESCEISLKRALKELSESFIGYFISFARFVLNFLTLLLLAALAPNSGGVPEATAADLSATTDADMLKRLKFQEGEIDRLQSLADELDKQRRMNRELTIKMKTLKDELAQSQKETKQA